MVWGAISEKGKIPLIFVDRGVKINKEYYQREKLESVLKPEARRLFPEGGWPFQQNSTPETQGKTEPRVLKSCLPEFHQLKRMAA